MEQVNEELSREALPVCQCGVPYSKHGKGTLACPPRLYLAMKSKELPLETVERVAGILADDGLDGDLETLRDTLAGYGLGNDCQTVAEALTRIRSARTAIASMGDDGLIDALDEANSALQAFRGIKPGNGWDAELRQLDEAQTTIRAALARTSLGTDAHD